MKTIKNVIFRYRMQIICCIIFCFVNTIIQCQTKEPASLLSKDFNYTRTGVAYRLNLKDSAIINLQLKRVSKYHYEQNDSINIPNYCSNNISYLSNEMINFSKISKYVQLNNMIEPIIIKKESSVGSDILYTAAVVAASVLLVWVFSWQFH